MGKTMWDEPFQQRPGSDKTHRGMTKPANGSQVLRALLGQLAVGVRLFTFRAPKKSYADVVRAPDPLRALVGTSAPRNAGYVTSG
jgi:hypothetical protein